jgi:hypothetical protein
MSEEEASNATGEDFNEDDEVEIDCDDEDNMMHNSLAFGDMLDSVLSRHLEYNQDDSTLSLAEILLLIKQSIDAQTAVMSEMLRLKMSKYGSQSAPSHTHHSTSSTHSRQPRQETPEERAIRKAKEAAGSRAK